MFPDYGRARMAETPGVSAPGHTTALAPDGRARARALSMREMHVATLYRDIASTLDHASIDLATLSPAATRL